MFLWQDLNCGKNSLMGPVRMTAPQALSVREQVWMLVGSQRLVPDEKQKLHLRASPVINAQSRTT